MGNDSFQFGSQTSIKLTQSNIHHTRKFATPLQLKLKEKTKFKLTPSHFLRRRGYSF